MEKNSETKPLVKKITFVPRWANMLGGFIGIIIIAGIAESWYFFKLTLLETVILAAVLFVFYLIILSVILRPRTVFLKEKAIKKVKDEVSGVHDAEEKSSEVKEQTAKKESMKDEFVPLPITGEQPKSRSSIKKETEVKPMSSVNIDNRASMKKRAKKTSKKRRK